VLSTQVNRCRCLYRTRRRSACRGEIFQRFGPSSRGKYPNSGDSLTFVKHAEPLQNRQHAQTPYVYLDQIWHAVVGQWSMLTGLMLSGSVYCVVDAGQKTQKYRNFEQIFTSPLVPIPLYRSSHFGKRQYTHRLCLHAKFHLNPFVISPSRDEKPQFGAKIDIWGLLIQPQGHRQHNQSIVRNAHTCTTPYLTLIQTMRLSCTVFEL